MGARAVLDVSAFSGEFLRRDRTNGGRPRNDKRAGEGACGRNAGGERGILQPGVLTVNNGLTLEGTTFLSIRKGVGTEADKIQVTGESTSTLKFGGTLVLANLFGFAVSDLPRTFTVFSAPKFEGRFTGLAIQPVSDPSVRVDISELREGGNGTIRVLNGNRAPTATNIVIAVEKNGAVSFELAKYAPDPDGDLVTPTFSDLPEDDRVTFTNGVATYRPTFNATGTRVFKYQVTDPSGLMSEDTAGDYTATIIPATDSGGNILSLSGQAPAPITVSFAGIPGGIYQGQFSSNLNSGVWTDVGAPATVGGNGKGSFEHANPPSRRLLPDPVGRRRGCYRMTRAK